MDRQYVGIDFHRRRSVIVRLSADSERLGLHRIVNDPLELCAVMGEAGVAPAVVIEATYGWYCAVDLLQELGATVHLANPKALNWGDRRVKNDDVDATDLADMLRLNRLPEAWIVNRPGSDGGSGYWIPIASLVFVSVKVGPLRPLVSSSR